MSTKIYDAYLFSGTLLELKEVLSEMREEICKDISFQLQAYMKSSIKEFCGYDSKICKAFLSETFSGEFTEESKLHELSNFELIWLLEKVQLSNRKGSLDELSSNAVVIPYKRLLIVQFFCLYDWEERIEKDKRFSDFHYQDQSDEYFNCSKYREKYNPTKNDLRNLRRNWNMRKKVWDEIYDRNNTPMEAGFQYTFVGQRKLWDIADSFRKKVKTIDFTISDNKLEKSLVEDKIIALAMDDEILKKGYIGELYDANFNSELYLIYEEPNMISSGVITEIETFAEEKGVIFNVVEMKDREKYRSPYDRNSGATSIGTICYLTERYKDKINDEDEDTEFDTTSANG